MLAVKGIYRDGNIELLEPIEGIQEAELYIVVVPKEVTRDAIGIITEEGETEEFPEWTKEVWNAKIFESETFYMMKLQEESGFAKSVLADEKEDVWNDF